MASVIIVFFFAGYVEAGMPNPADVYCIKLGYQAKTITEEDGGQYSICVFPDGNTCDAWMFLEGTCGKEYSYCAKNGYDQIVKTDGKNPFSRTYAVCVSGSVEMGNPLDLMGITKELTRPLPEKELPPISPISPISPTPIPKDAQPMLPGMPGVPPPAFDWRTYQGVDWMTPVKNQSSCGSCWAFGAVGTVEAIYNIHQQQPNLDINLSEEYVTADCNGHGQHGCCGGWHHSALGAIRDKGLPDEQCMVYDVTQYSTGICSCYPNPPCNADCPNGGGTDTCSFSPCEDACFDVEHRLVHIENWSDVGDSEAEIKAALISHGPLATALNWGFAGSSPDGVFYCNDGNGVGETHCVIITGWDDSVENGLTDGDGNPLHGAWIIKNSHGNRNNGDGYRLVAYNDCRVQNRAVWVQAANTSFSSISIPNDITFDNTCVDGTSRETLNICNTGKADLLIYEIASNNTQFQVTEPLQSCWDMDGNGAVDIPAECSGGMPARISPDFCYPFEVAFSPTSTSTQTAKLTVRSNDIGKPSITVNATGNGTEPVITASIANSGVFGNVCIGNFKDIDLTINNSGNCDLVITSISSSNAEFQVPSAFSAVIAPGGSQAVPVRFAPTSLGAKNADINIISNDPATPTATVAVSGTANPGDIRVTGSTDFGNVCAEEQSEKTVKVCNVGLCNLNVTSVLVDCPDFTLINNPFPALVSPDSCLDLVVRFTPISAGPKTCNLTINSNDPETPVVTRVLTANTPLPSIDIPLSQTFPATVIQSVEACMSQEPFPVSNTGSCNLTINSIAITDNATEYALSGLPSSPIILEPGHIAGAGDLRTVFNPITLDRDLTGQISVTYISEPITGATTTVTRELCGEGVRTGARVLVTHNGVPMTEVKQIRLLRLGVNRNKNQLDTVDVVKDVMLQSVIQAAPCSSFEYHREYGAVSNPIQLAPGSYEVSVLAVVNGKLKKKSVGFDVSSCDFNQDIIIDL